MRCLACGAEMQLREVVLADIPTMPGFEHHTFRCSACPQVTRRLVICRAKMPIVDPPIPAHPDAPVIQREMGQACGPKRVAECGREAQQQTGGSSRTKGPRLGASGQEAQHGPQRPSSGSEGLGLGKDGREAPQQTAGSRGARGNCEDHRYGQRVQPDAKHARALMGLDGFIVCGTRLSCSKQRRQRTVRFPRDSQGAPGPRSERARVVAKVRKGTARP
jgi:hypothetical protein